VTPRDEFAALFDGTPMPAVIKTVCCQCYKVIRDGPPFPVSHGYCEICGPKWYEECMRLKA
jgi:hypothetical protein